MTQELESVKVHFVSCGIHCVTFLPPRVSSFAPRASSCPGKDVYSQRSILEHLFDYFQLRHHLQHVSYQAAANGHNGACHLQPHRLSSLAVLYNMEVRLQS